VNGAVRNGALPFRARLLLIVTIRRDPERRGCFIPQPHNAHALSNVIHGAFTAAKVSEWAALCSVHDTSQILIYRFGASAGAGVIDSLERAMDHRVDAGNR
jgi:hypothetical protein